MNRKFKLFWGLIRRRILLNWSKIELLNIVIISDLLISVGLVCYQSIVMNAPENVEYTIFTTNTDE